MYREFFGLTEDPFNLTPDPHFIYSSVNHQEAFSTLLYGIRYKKGFIAITGEIGAGKTTLCRKLLAETREEARTALILNPTLSDIQLLSAIIDDFGIRPKVRNKKGFFDALNQFLIEVSKKGLIAVLIIDEAQNLSPKTLEQIRLLSNLETEREKLIQIVLVGQPELRQTLADPSLRQLHQRIALKYHLPALKREETVEYVLHRLRVAGSKERQIFTGGALGTIHEKTGGIPRLINCLCDQAMLAAFVNGTHEIDEYLIKSVVHEDEEVAV